jgi:hypothetical protein
MLRGSGKPRLVIPMIIEGIDHEPIEAATEPVLDMGQNPAKTQVGED